MIAVLLFAGVTRARERSSGRAPVSRRAQQQTRALEQSCFAVCMPPLFPTTTITLTKGTERELHNAPQINPACRPLKQRERGGEGEKTGQASQSLRPRRRLSGPLLVVVALNCAADAAPVRTRREAPGHSRKQGADGNKTGEQERKGAAAGAAGACTHTDSDRRRLLKV